MEILVTGGAGFIGSHLCEHLVHIGHKITVIDDFSTGSLSNLESIINQIEVIEKKIEDFNFNNFNDFKAVVHLAAQASVPISINNFYESSKTNLLGTLRVADFCSTTRTPLVYASSSAVYGALDLGDDMSEQVSLLSPYAADKYAMELYCNVLSKTKGLSCIGLRFFNVYGPRQNPSNPYSGVISKFLSNIKYGKALEINGGHQTRDFVYVTDVAYAITKAIDESFAINTCDVMNVLTGRSVSIDWLADAVIDLSGRDVEKQYKPLLLGDPVQSRGSITKLESMLGERLKEFVTLKSGLSETAKFIQNSTND